MSLLKSISLMGVTGVARLGASLATFAITARILGVERYGELMYWMSIASLLTIVSNFGLVGMLLKEVGQRPLQAVEIFSESLSAKLIIVGTIVLGSCIALPFMSAPSRGVFLLLLAAMLFEGFTEFFNSGFRARSRFGVETRIAMVSAWVYPLSVGLMAWLSQSLLAIAAAYMVSRGVITWLTWRQVRLILGKIRPSRIRVGLTSIRHSLSYAADAALGGVFGQIDSVVLNHFLGHSAVGVHQAGMRLFLAGTGFGSILANVFLPRAAAANLGTAAGYAAENGKLQFAFLAVGVGFGLVMAVGGQWFAPLLFGASFNAVVPLMPWFGLLFMVRFAGLAWSISLTAQGKQWYRAKVAAVHWVLIFATAWFAVPAWGNVGWLIALIAGNVLLLVAYAAKAANRTSVDAKTLGLTVVLLFVFVPMLSLR